MKTKSAVRLLCKDCYFVRKAKRLYVRCKTWPRHKQRQGFATMVMTQNQIQAEIEYIN